MTTLQLSHPMSTFVGRSRGIMYFPTHKNEMPNQYKYRLLHHHVGQLLRSLHCGSFPLHRCKHRSIRTIFWTIYRIICHCTWLAIFGWLQADRHVLRNHIDSPYFAIFSGASAVIKCGDNGAFPNFPHIFTLLSLHRQPDLRKLS